MRRRLVTGGVAAAAMLVAGCSSGGSSPAADEGVPSSTGTATSVPATQVDGTREPTGGLPVGLAVVDGRLWVAAADDDQVQVPGDGPPVPVGAAPLRLQEVHGELWVSVFGAGLVVAVDPDSRRVVDRVHVGQEPEGLAAADGDLWVVDQARGRLVRVHGGAVTDSVSVGLEPRLVEAGRLAGQDALWVSVYGEQQVVRVDPATGRVEATAPVCAGPQGMAQQSSVLWVACTLTGELVGLDAATLRPVGRVSGLLGPDGVVAGRGDTVLVAEQAGPGVAVIDVSDPSHPAATSRVAVGDRPGISDGNVDLVTERRGVWLSSPDDAQVVLLTWEQLAG